MPNPFWNAQERRLRVFWRLILQAVLLVVLQSAPVALLLIVPSGTRAAIDPTNPLVFPENPLLSGLAVMGTFLTILISVWLAGKWFDRRKFINFGFHFNPRWWLDLWFGLALGAALMTFIFLVELSAGWITIQDTLHNETTGLSFGWAIFEGAFLFFWVGIQEELLSRGYQLRNLAEGLNLPGIGPSAAVLSGYFLSSIIFGALHAANPNANLISTANIMIAGLFLGLGYILTGELAIPIGAHMTWNFFEGYVYGFPVSGTMPSGSFIAIRQGGSDLWTGGAFGPEAGLIGLIAMLLGGLLVYAWVNWQHHYARLQIKLAEYPTQQPVYPDSSTLEVKNYIDDKG